MFALRTHLSVATVALVLVIPVVIGVVVGGPGGGATAVVAGFLVYDLVFIPPYYTLSVGSSENWVALVVYVIIVVFVARVVTLLDRARTESRRRQADAQRLFELSELILAERPLSDLLTAIVSMVRDAFSLEAAVLLLPSGERRDGPLELAAAAGRELTAEELRRVVPEPGSLTRIREQPDEPSGNVVVLSVGDRPVGLLGLVGPPLREHQLELLGTLANHIALTLDRAQLREQAVRMGVLEQVDRLRQAMMGAVSHDLRTPLATIKTSVSALLEPDVSIGTADRAELLGLVEAQTDRLTRLVANLLDLTRIETGALALRRDAVDVGDLVRDAIESLGPAVDRARVRVEMARNLPIVELDQVLISQVIVNLLENGLRYSPDGAMVVVSAGVRAGAVEISVADEGPGIAPADRTAVFELFRRAGPEAGPPTGGSGVGLAIAKAFVEAHGGRIWVRSSESGGARVSFEVPTREDAAVR